MTNYLNVTKRLDFSLNILYKTIEKLLERGRKRVERGLSPSNPLSTPFQSPNSVVSKETTPLTIPFFVLY